MPGHKNLRITQHCAKVLFRKVCEVMKIAMNTFNRVVIFHFTNFKKNVISWLNLRFLWIFCRLKVQNKGQSENRKT